MLINARKCFNGLFGIFTRYESLLTLPSLPHTVRVKTSILPTKRFLSKVSDFDLEEVLHDEEYEEFSNKIFRLPQHGHNVLVLQPFIRQRHDMKPAPGNTTPELQLEEAISLVRTLPRWEVSDSRIIGVPSYNRQAFFGSGQMEDIRDGLNKDQRISAIFVSVNILRVKQIINLENYFKLPVFDRYTIVMQIFRHHARTNESKLQIAMAEIPYLRQCVKGFQIGLSDRLSTGGVVGGQESRLFRETRRELLHDREQKLKKALESLRKHRERLRIAKQTESVPNIAVMGYTNAGKTSLIKALTGAESLQPRDQLFATLDVTRHEGRLPCNLKVLYIDTVGFITDIPTGLIESFHATLEDAVHADVIIHVWDVSNPDFRKQQEHVEETLSNLKIENLESKILTVANKVDRISKEELDLHLNMAAGSHFVSTKTGFGMDKMLENLQNKVMECTQRIRMKIRVRNGSDEYEWIQKEFPMEDLTVEDNNEFSIFTVVITKAQLDIFKHRFLRKERL